MPRVGTGHTLEAARAAKSKAKAIFGRYGDVNGVGITRVGEGYGVKINLVSLLSKRIDWPQRIDDVPVVVEVVGRVVKRPGARAGGPRVRQKSAADKSHG